MIKDQPSTSRRGLIKSGLTAVAVNALARPSAARERVAQAPAKLAQSAVQYQQKPKGDQRCSVCINWEPPNACKIVEGVINPIGWCVAFAPKSG